MKLFDAFRMFKWFNFLNIGQKIILGYGLTIGVAVVGIGIGYKIASFHQYYANLLIEDALEELLLLNRLENSLLLARNAQLQVIMTPNSPSFYSHESRELLNHLVEVKQVWSRFNAEHGSIDVYAPGESLEEKQATDTLVTSYQKLEPWLVKVRQIVASQDNKIIVPETTAENLYQQLRETNETYLISLNQFIEALHDLTNLVIIEYEDAEVASRQAEALQLNIIIASLLLSVLIATGLALSIIQTIVHPLQKVTKVAQEVTQTGNFEHQVPVTTSDEVGLLASSFNQLIGQVKQLLHNQSETNKKLADYNQTLEQKVQERTQELSQTLRQLQTAQAEIIQSEKMAALGHLVAGIAHEVNTPLAAIQASISNINSSLEQSLKQLPQLFQQLSAEQLNEFCLLLSWATQPKAILSSREERQLRRRLKQSFMEEEIESAHQLADILSKMNINESLDPILPILKNASAAFILNCAYQLASIQNNSKNINLAAERAAKIVFALKNYIYKDSSGTMLKSNLPESIDLVLILYENQIKRGIEVTKNYQSVPAIFCYPEDLTQVWSNLIGNAIQAMNYRGKLKIQVREQDSYVVVEIEDSGSGIPPNIQEKIFDPFFTTKAPGEGSGLGLHIVKQIIEKHQGKIEFFTQVGYTKFRVWLPITQSDDHVRQSNSLC